MFENFTSLASRSLRPYKVILAIVIIILHIFQITFCIKLILTRLSAPLAFVIITRRRMMAKLLNVMNFIFGLDRNEV